MKIYVASSWRNAFQPAVVNKLRDLGHDVYDFRNPPEGTGFHWKSTLEGVTLTTVEGRYLVGHALYQRMLAHPAAERGFGADIRALDGCDAVVFVLPCGKSASWELGYAMAKGKLAYVLWLGEHEPELMFMGAIVLGSMLELVESFGPQGHGCPF